MYTTEISLRVRYAETDRMGYAYYGNYATYFEVARVEALRQLGITYKELEDEGILLPVSEYHIKYFKPAFYDDEIIIKTSIIEVPGVRLRFEYETFVKDVQINKASTDLVFVDKISGRPMKAPSYVVEKLASYFAKG